MKKEKDFIVTVSQTWSDTFVVKAKTQVEARKKAWENYKPKRKNYLVSSEKI